VHVVATAGHVDHGKSTLIRALTGMEPDRWAEERRRGMTIDLGFAWTDLPSGRRLAFVDVPGHERFVPNMLAGVGSVPAVLLVVAADEGWQAQTGEHVQALDALAVRHGVLAVSRSDLADPTDVMADVVRRLADTSLADLVAVRVSGRTGAGLPRLRAELDRLLDRLPPADDRQPVRLWIDRSFSIRGAGTVVTGTLAAGRIAIGDRLRVLPAGVDVSVRALETCKQQVPSVGPTSRVAVNLRGIASDRLARGDALVQPDGCLTSHAVDVRLTGPAPGRRPTLHVGSAAVPVRLRPLGEQPATARLVLDRPLPLRVGDRGLLRDPGRPGPLVGILVLDPDPPDLRRRGAARDRAAQLAAVDAVPDGDDLLAWRGFATRGWLTATGVPEPTSEVVRVGDWRVAGWQWAAWRDQLIDLTNRRRDPLGRGRSAGELRQLLGVPDGVFAALVAEAAELESADGWLRRRDSGGPLFDASVEDALREVEQRLRDSPFRAPEAAELTRLGLTRRVLGAAVGAGRLIRVGPDVYLLPDAPRTAVGLLTRLPAPFTVSDARQALGTTRRVAVPLLEHLDATGRTRRLPDGRRLLVD
jgi:selenocysteine-specific elongation factor